jgi:hypothetical protein
MNQASKGKKRIICEGLFCIIGLCALNAIFTFFSYNFLLKSKFAKFLDFAWRVNLGAIEFEIPYRKKNFILLMLILSISSIISKITMNYFENYKFEYKKYLNSKSLIKEPIKKSEESANKDFIFALLIVAFGSLYRNGIREPREILQFIFNNFEKIGWKIQIINSRAALIFNMFCMYIIIYPLVTLIDISVKYVKSKEDQRCGELLNKLANQSKSLKEKKSFISLGLVTCIMISTFLGLVCAKICVYFRILENLKIYIHLTNNFFTLLDNSSFLITNLFFDFIFFFGLKNLCFTGEDNKFKFKEKNQIRELFIIFFHATFYTIAVSSTIFIEGFIRKNQIDDALDIIKIIGILTAVYFMFVLAPDGIRSYFQIEYEKKNFVLVADSSVGEEAHQKTC